MKTKLIYLGLIVLYGLISSCDHDIIRANGEVIIKGG